MTASMLRSMLLLLLLVVLVPWAGAFSSAQTVQQQRQRLQAPAAAKTVDCGVIIAGAGPAGKSGGPRLHVRLNPDLRASV